jgi:hypothetical protein
MSSSNGRRMTTVLLQPAAHNSTQQHKQLLSHAFLYSCLILLLTPAWSATLKGVSGLLIRHDAHLKCALQSSRLCLLGGIKSQHTSNSPTC